MILRFSLLAAILASLTFSPAATNKPLDPEITPDSLASTSSFYSFRRDMRRCASPRCGGYFVKLVNQSRTRCADGRNQSECYVADIDWRGQAEPDSDRGLLRGTIRRKGQFGEFRVTEAWQAASANQPADRFFRVRDRGLRCIAAPCPTHHEATLNSTASRNIAGVDLSGAGAPESIVSDATQAMTSPDGILVSGNHSPVTGPAGRMQMLKATQFYVRTGGSGSGSGNVSLKPCKKTGCSSQVCSDEDVITTCEFRPEYACYQKAACERQKNGDCGFTQTPELLRCLSRARRQ
ncbi:MAG TPA: DUF6748 domain-containing protein [Pyrinomonadaceae bacterium]|nr:DUF6748 domain-containing protein [Pyrinomonadaceae bacterium]